jgi:hypothetical protein
VLFQVPGWVGIALAVVGAVLGGVLAGLFSERRSRSLDALAWPDRPVPGVDGVSADAGLDRPDLGLSGDIDDLTRAQLDAALGISTAGVR